MPEGKKNARLVLGRIRKVTQGQDGKPPMAHTHQGGGREVDWLCGFPTTRC
jgi:hypothetical protein